MTLLRNPAAGEIIVPSWVAARLYEKRRREIEAMAQEARDRKDAGYVFEQERAKQDTKPLLYQDTSERHRPVLVVGGGGLWYQDAKEKALRLKEKPNPASDPDLGMTKRNVKEDLYVALDRHTRRAGGVRTFIMLNNPIAAEDSPWRRKRQP